MRTYHHFSIFFSLLLGSGLFAEANPPPSPRATSWTVEHLVGWTIRVDDRLYTAEHTGLRQRTLRFLENKLTDILTVLPPSKTVILQQYVIVLDLNHGDLSIMQFHPSAVWLKNNGYDESLAGCVHIPVAAKLATRRNIVEQPWSVLHELAHAYHYNVLDFSHPEIRTAWENYKTSGHGDKTLLFNGRRVEHYALTNEKEFFAEMTEAYWGSNDFFPFNRGELKEHEPAIYALMEKIWNQP